MIRKLFFRLSGLVCLIIMTVAANAESIPIWSRWDHSLTASDAASPETEFAVKFTSPTKRTLIVTGFWDGGTTWRVRFMPDEAGKWTYQTRSVPRVSGLDGQAGEFTCRSKAGSTRFLRHGAVHVSANGRFFEHADGTAFLWVGDTVWYGAILSAKEDWNTYLSDRVNKRFDVVHFNVVAPRNGVAADENGEISFQAPDQQDWVLLLKTR